jgi:flagellar M-ring protein FliF
VADWWNSLDLRRRITAGVAAACLLAGLLFAAWWAARPDMAALFSDLSPEDAAVIAGELDKQKVPYAVSAGGGTLLVERSQVHTTRLKLMARELPLHGAIGFELFNQSDLGMTEFMQKVNWQRALQGELTRTIAAFPQVRRVRVHLAMPEHGLFRQSTQAAKAVVNLALRERAALDPQQVQGIQRLVAAAVPGLSPAEVTVVDERGVALTRSASQDGAGSWQLDLKRDVESYLARKAAAVLEGAVGPGLAMASVDAALNLDQVRRTTEDIVGVPDASGAAVAGVLVRERESTRDAPADAKNADGRPPRGASSQRDAEYQAGRRVEQVVSQPGSIRRLHVVAIVKTPLEPAQRAQLATLLGAAVGVAPDRGDTVVVHAYLPRPVAAEPASEAAPEPAAAGAPETALAWPWFAAAASACILALLVAIRLRRMPQARLTQPQRQLALGQVRAWLDTPSAAREADGRNWTASVREAGRDA